MQRVSLCFQEPIQGPENGSIARFDGLFCYQTKSKKPIAACAACGLAEAAPQSPSQRGQTAKRRHGQTATAKRRRPKSGGQRAAAKEQRPKSSGQRAATKRRRLNRKGQTARARRNHRGAFALANSVPAAHFSGANSRPRKQPHRTVLGALLLSNQERENPHRSPCGLRKLRRKAQASAAKRRHGQTATAERQRPNSGGQTAATKRWRLNRKSQTQPSRRFRACEFRARRSFFRSKFKAPKTAPSHGLTGLAAIKSVANKRCLRVHFGRKT